MNIALTGASGSIGRLLSPFLKSLGFDVIFISSSMPGNKENIFSYADLRNNNIPLEVDYVIHLASHNSNLEDKKIHEEVKLTDDILNAMANICCNKIIFFSTGKVYGDNSNTQNTFDENSNLNPACSYSKAKKLCEEKIINKSKEEDFFSIILRLPPALINSESSNLGKLISISKKEYPIFSLFQGDHNQRSFISAKNIQIAIEVLLSRELKTKNQIYNLSDSGYISLNDLLRCHRKKGIYILSLPISKFIYNLPFIEKILLKLYGNFMLDNKKIRDDLNVKLLTTMEALSITNQ
jgi:nucleoside-diphosphate-sugar epimerase